MFSTLRTHLLAPLARRLRRGGPQDALPLVMYTRGECGLCDRMEADLAAAQSIPTYALRKVDVDRDPDLARRYGNWVPVLWVGRRQAFRGPATVHEIERTLPRLARLHHEDLAQGRVLEELTPEAAHRDGTR